MSRKRHSEAEQGAGRGRFAVLLALIILSALAATPLILGALHLRINLGAPTTVNGVRLLPAPNAPPQVTLSPVASPIAPGRPPTSLPAVSAATQASAVAAEDNRIRILVHAAASVYQPEVVPVRGALPSLVLTAGPHTYTYADLIQYGALVLLPNHAALLLDNVFVSTNARLDLGMPTLRALYLDSSAGGFTSIVAWGGSLSFQGTQQQPFTIMGWNRTTKSPAKDAGSGRPYIREVGGRMNIIDVRASALGFWSGRTSGVAWTGATGKPSTGSATSSTFTDATYGAFVARGRGVTFYDDLFEFNELDGLHIHRNAVGTSVSASASARNGGNGFLVDRATSGTVLKGDVSRHNTGDGFLIDGRPLVTGASASGSSVTADSGTSVENSAALDNAKTGILLEGGSGTVLRSDEVCAKLTGIAIRYGASNTVVTGNDVRCGPRVALSVGPVAPNTMVSGNALVNARIGMLVRNSGHLEADKNRITGARVFGITARGESSQVTGQANVISGTGFRAVDARADADAPSLSDTQDAGWAHHVKANFWSYLRFHPLAMLWVSILVLVIGGEIWSRIRRMPAHPYPNSTHWRPASAGRAPRVPAEAHAEPALAGAMAGAGGVLHDRAPVRALEGTHTADGLRLGSGHRPPDAARPAREHWPAEVMTPGNGHRHADGATVAGSHRAAGGLRPADGHGPGGWARPGEGHRIQDETALADAGRSASGAGRPGGHTPADDYGLDEARLDGREPADGRRSMDGRLPGEWFSPTAGQRAADGYQPADAHQPVDRYHPSNGHGPVDGHAPAGGWGAADGHGRAEGHPPGEWFSSTAGHRPGDGANPGDRVGHRVGPASPAEFTQGGHGEQSDATSPLPRVEDWL